MDFYVSGTMKMIFNYVLYGTIITISGAYGNNVTLLENKVISGRHEAIAKYSFVVLIYGLFMKHSYIFTGSLINNDYILTTDKYVGEINDNRSYFQLYYKDSFNHFSLPVHVGKAYEYEFSHKNRRSSPSYVALVEVKGTVNCVNVGYIEDKLILPPLKIDDEVTVIGWTYSYLKPPPGIKLTNLRSVVARVLGNEECAKRYNVDKFDVLLNCLDVKPETGKLQMEDIGSPVFDKDKNVQGFIIYVPENGKNLPVSIIGSDYVLNFISKIKRQLEKI